MSTHNICFHREIRKILCGYPLLSVAMLRVNMVYVLTGREFPDQSVHLCLHCLHLLQVSFYFRTAHMFTFVMRDTFS